LVQAGANSNILLEYEIHKNISHMDLFWQFPSVKFGRLNILHSCKTFITKG